MAVSLMVARQGRDLMVARQGRELQRYNSNGGRLVVGCIPYRLKIDEQCSGNTDQELEVLVISAQKGHGMMFPKGGWEIDETITQAASREALEEAGVQGDIEDVLGKWTYKSRSHGINYEGIMYPLNVTEELTHWPEMSARKRRWGGWEIDESITQAASREAVEEAGVQGEIEDVLGKWMYKSRSYGTFYEGFMFPMKVNEELMHWPEMNARKRQWVSVTEAMEGCKHLWMKEALERLVIRLSNAISPEAALHGIPFIGRH